MIKEKIKTKKNKTLILTFLLLLLLSVGFAFLTTNLSILGNTLLKSQTWDIHFENVQVSEDSIQIEKPVIVENRTKVEYNITLDKPGDFVEFTVDAKNDGTIDAMIKTITPLTLYEAGEEIEIPDYLEYSVTYEDGSEILAKQQLRRRQKVTYKVHVEYKKNILKSDLVTEQKNLTAEFDVEYVQADNTAIPDNYHEVTESELDKTKFKNFANTRNPKQLIFVDTGVSDYTNSKYTDISKNQDKSILAWMDGNTMYVSAKEADVYVKAPVDSSSLMGNYGDSRMTWCENLEKVDLSKLDTSVVTDMSHMLYSVGRSSTNFEIVGLESWNVSNVENMRYLFSRLGYSSSIFELDLSKWNTINVKNMSAMFFNAGNQSTTWSIGDLSEWDTSNVTDMSAMFSSAGNKTTTWSVGDIGKWDTSNVQDRSQIFETAALNAKTLEMDLSNWKTGKVEDMQYMFQNFAQSATVWSVGDLSGWDTSKVKNMSSTFQGAGLNSNVFDIGDISIWDTSNVTKMYSMFDAAGRSASYHLDLSGWNVDKVTSYEYFNSTVTSKITPPNWVN